MPWEETDLMSERLRFIHRLQDGERMTDLCREFGISRKTGYKVKERFEQGGSHGLADKSRAPHRRPHTTPKPVVDAILALKKKYPTWGAKKLRAELPRRHPGVHVPASSTIGLILRKHGLVTPRRTRRNTPAYVGPLRRAEAPNEVWCADFKGQFRLQNQAYCYPLTITDQHSRFILGCEALESTGGESARAVFEHVFDEYGLPEVIRTDNGAPFASRGLGGFSALSVWWMRLGILPERIEPGHPEQNGRHERMHRTLKAETTRPSGQSSLQQQERFDRFVHVFNTERPHEGIQMRRPADVYDASNRKLEPLGDSRYPLHDDELRIRKSGHLAILRRPIYIAQTLANEVVGVRELEQDRWLVSFEAFNLGIINTAQQTFEPDVRLVETGGMTN